MPAAATATAAQDQNSFRITFFPAPGGGRRNRFAGNLGKVVVLGSAREGAYSEGRPGVPEEIPALRFIESRQTLPFRDGIDGAFAAKFERR